MDQNLISLVTLQTRSKSTDRNSGSGANVMIIIMVKTPGIESETPSSTFAISQAEPPLLSSLHCNTLKLSADQEASSPAYILSKRKYTCEF